MPAEHFVLLQRGKKMTDTQIKRFQAMCAASSPERCAICRDKVRGRGLRESIFQLLKLDTVNFECPSKLPWAESGLRKIVRSPAVVRQYKAVVHSSDSPSKWFLTSQCRSRVNCTICRDERLPGWRRGILRRYPATASDEHFDCPFGVPSRKK